MNGLGVCFCLLVGYLAFYSCTQSKSLLHGQLSASWMRAFLNIIDRRAEPALPSFSKNYLTCITALVSMTWLLMKMVYGHKMQTDPASQPCCHKEFILVELGQLA